MSVLTVQQFIERIGEVEADAIAGTGPRGERSIDETKIGTALAFTDALIAGKLHARYPVLPAPAPEILKGLAQDIALYRLRYKTGDQSGVSDETVKRYNAAIRELDAIAAGSIALDPTAPAGVEGTANPQPVLVAGEPARAGTILEGWLR